MIDIGSILMVMAQYQRSCHELQTYYVMLVPNIVTLFNIKCLIISK